ncbi:MAG TPA: hypothetical protein VMV32_00365, partial [Ignavibacteriaceae bacterium]|nr:hypothetical protein [Ignavibacteriaceae bacterium]
MIKIKNKTRYKTKILGIALLSILLLIGLIPLIQLEPSTNTTLLENSNLNSAEAVTISSPSGTYSTGMSGYYPAFFGFENDNSGSNPSYWYCYEPT